MQESTERTQTEGRAYLVEDQLGDDLHNRDDHVEHGEVPEGGHVEGAAVEHRARRGLALRVCVCVCVCVVGDGFVVSAEVREERGVRLGWRGV
jgi:hypothetical protein